MTRMRRTQVYLEPELAEALDRLARQRCTSRAELLRQAARRLLDEEPGDSGAATDDPIWGIIGVADAGPGQVSVQHDRVLVEHSREHIGR
jgi:metal-responsive CopG/Arc/MetJ family transcriptional regulator